MTYQHNKKSKRKIIGWIVISTLALLILIPSGIYAVKHNYSLAKMLPVNKETKIRAFWLSIDENKLEKLKQENKIDYYHTSSNDINIAIGHDGYLYSFLFLRHALELPSVSVISFDDTLGNKVKIGYHTDGTTIKDLFNFKNIDSEEISNNYKDISESEIDELTKNGLKLYNQFIEDYNNL